MTNLTQERAGVTPVVGTITANQGTAGAAAWLVKTTPSYLGSPQRLTMAGAAQAATLPANTNYVIIVAEAADLRYAINAVSTSTSPGYIPASGTLVLRCSNLSSLSVYGAAGAFANLTYFQEPS